MDVLTFLANFGGFAVAAGMIFILHREALKTFTSELRNERDLYLMSLRIMSEEQKKERDIFSTNWKDFLVLELKEHADLNKQLDAIFMEVRRP